MPNFQCAQKSHKWIIYHKLFNLNDSTFKTKLCPTIFYKDIEGNTGFHFGSKCKHFLFSSDGNNKRFEISGEY